MTEVLLLAAALFVILAPTYLSEVMSGVEVNNVPPPRAKGDRPLALPGPAPARQAIR